MSFLAQVLAWLIVPFALVAEHLRLWRARREVAAETAVDQAKRRQTVAEAEHQETLDQTTIGRELRKKPPGERLAELKDRLGHRPRD